MKCLNRAKKSMDLVTIETCMVDAICNLKAYDNDSMLLFERRESFNH